jgi:hypothetical protein
MGDLILMESSGEFKMVLSELPGQGFKIYSILSFSLGFLLAGENGRILVY